MPQVGTHIVIADRVTHELSSNEYNYLRSHPEAARLGAVGPDLALFLFDPAGESDILNVAFKIYQIQDDFSTFIEEVKEMASGPVEDFEDWITGGLSTQIDDFTRLAYKAIEMAALVTTLPSSSITINNPFFGTDVEGVPHGQTLTLEATDLSFMLRGFGHPYTEDLDEVGDNGYVFKEPSQVGDYSKWWWVDVLHYRRTGLFAKQLFANANTNLQRAYATGYATHIAGDVCGHPYVNAVVGGPFRSHVIRHMVMENIIDTWVWNHYGRGDLSTSGLHTHVDVGNHFGDIASLLRSTMKDIYTGVQDDPIAPKHYPDSIPRMDEFERAYDLMMRYLEKSTTRELSMPEPPPGSPQEFFEEIGESLLGTLGEISEQFDSDNEWWEWLLAPFVAALYALLFIFKLLTLPAAILARLAALHGRWLIYFLELALYDYLTNVNWMLALGGWGKVSSDDLVREFSQIAVHIPPDRQCLPGSFRYPYEQVPHDFQAFWLQDPRFTSAALEEPKNEVSPYCKNFTPDVFIDGPGYNTSRDDNLRKFAEAPEISHTVAHQWATCNGAQFGNAVEFAMRLITGKYPWASFDLDSDRGYAFLGWDKKPDDNNTPVYRKHF